MKKTKIKFEDIKAGDLIEVNKTEYGVKNSHTGIAFELEKDFAAPGTDAWKTSEDGIISVSNNGETIYRIDVVETKFEDVQLGDKLKVTSKTGNVTTIIEGVATVKVVEAISPYWVDKNGHILLFKMLVPETEQTIEILERSGE